MACVNECMADPPVRCYNSHELPPEAIIGSISAPWLSAVIASLPAVRCFQDKATAVPDRFSTVPGLQSCVYITDFMSLIDESWVFLLHEWGAMSTSSCSTHPHFWGLAVGLSPTSLPLVGRESSWGQGPITGRRAHRFPTATP